MKGGPPTPHRLDAVGLEHDKAYVCWHMIVAERGGLDNPRALSHSARQEAAARESLSYTYLLLGRIPSHRPEHRP